MRELYGSVDPNILAFVRGRCSDEENIAISLYLCITFLINENLSQLKIFSFPQLDLLIHNSESVSINHKGASK